MNSDSIVSNPLIISILLSLNNISTLFLSRHIVKSFNFQGLCTTLWTAMDHNDNEHMPTQSNCNYQTTATGLVRASTMARPMYLDF